MWSRYIGLRRYINGSRWIGLSFPTETVAINNLANAGKIQEAIEIYRWFLPLLELDISTKLVQNLKYIC